MYKTVLVLCAQVLFVQSALCQCSSRAAVADIGTRYPLGYTKGSYGLSGLKCPYGYGDSWGYDGAYGLSASWGRAEPAIDYIPTSSSGLSVSSSSANAPVGLSVTSENVYEGKLAAAGELPFLGTVSVEGVLPTAGTGNVNHHCGDGINSIVSDGIGYAGTSKLGYSGALKSGYTAAFGLGLGASSLGSCGARKSCGCGIY